MQQLAQTRAKTPGLIGAMADDINGIAVKYGHASIIRRGQERHKKFGFARFGFSL
jgi:hypothetical protein